MTNLFPLTEEDIRCVLNAALSDGGQYADIFLEHTTINNVNLQDRLVSQAVQAVLYGAGIRVTCGAQTGFAYTMDLSMPAMLSAARYAATIARYATHDTAPQSLPGQFAAIVPDSKPSGDSVDSMTEIARLQHIDEAARNADERVRSVICSAMRKNRHVCFYNSLGERFEDFNPTYTRIVTVVLQQDEQTQMGTATAAHQIQAGVEGMSDDALVEKALAQASFLFTAKQTTGGEMPVVLAAGSSGIFMHEALGHAFEADFIRTGESIFSNKMGKQICDPSISIVDDATLLGNAGSVRVDDEGVAGQCTTLVSEGRLTSFLHDRSTAAHFGVAPTGNGRRESFRHAPQPRMRCTYMTNGTATEEDIIRSVKRGIYARSFTNGQVQIGAGDFTFFMKEGYLIEDGHLTTPLRDMNIIGNGPQALRDISMVANNLCIDTSAGMCGKGGQQVPVGQGLPTVKVDKLTVG